MKSVLRVKLKESEKPMRGALRIIASELPTDAAPGQQEAESSLGGTLSNVGEPVLPAVPDRKLGLVLGAGVVRGWAHIGVLQALAEMGVHPHVVCGCSSGAIVAAAYATGRLTALDERVRELTLRQVFRMLDVSFRGGGLLEGRRLETFFRDVIGDAVIEDVMPVFGAVATELYSGRELWLTSGSIIDAVRASVALPGVLVPFSIRGRWLIDGAMTNPLPVSLCRALGADVIIGVNLNGNLFGSKHRRFASEPPALEPGGAPTWLRRLSLGDPFHQRERGENGSAEINGPARPSYFDVTTQAVFVAQDFISRVRMAADPVDLLIAPAVANIGLLDFHRGAEAIEAGRAAAQEQAGAIRTVWQKCASAPPVDLLRPASDQAHAFPA